MRPYEQRLVELDEAGQLTLYEQGFVDGLRLYAYMRDGIYYVGTSGKTLALAVEDFLRERGKWPE